VSLLNPLADLVAWVIMHLHSWLGSIFGPDSGAAWGLSIVILVVLIRMCLIPLFVKQVHAQRKMAQHAPQLAELRKKYKNDKQRLNEETMKFYKENGVNPLAGCLPMIPQFIVFFALFYVLRAIAEWKPGQTPKYGLTVPVLESAQRATIFGVHLGDKLLFPHTPGMGVGPSIVALITVILSATTTFLTVRQSSKRGLMQTNVDPDNPMAATQKYMMYIVPFFSLTGLYWQYGLVLYWVTTNMWTLGQQYFMFRNWTTEDAQAASATASAAAGLARTTKSPARPASGAAKRTTSSARTETASSFDPRTAGSAKTGTAGSAKTGTAGSAKTGTASSARTATSGTRSSSAAKAATPGGASNGRSTAPRAAAGSATAGTGPERPRTGSARGDAAAAGASSNGQNGAAKRGLLGFGRPKQEAAPEPEEVPTTKVVRQQPVRQAKSKRSGKR
jgi:YidC/Oxa1 family membrane protein insertase